MIVRAAARLAVGAALLVGCSPPDPRAPSTGVAWGDDPRFADGLAEIATYDAALLREGAIRTARAYTILVSEDLVPSSLVKADDWRRPGLLRAHKFAVHTAVPTGMSQFRESTVVFLEQATYAPLRVTYSSQDFCGLTFEELLRRGDRWVHRWSSYWEDDGGHGERFLPDGIPVDALPAWVRAIPLRPGMRFERTVILSLQGSQASSPPAVVASFEVSGPHLVEVPAGRFDTFEVRVRGEGVDLQVSVERQFPNRVVAWTDTLGQSFRLVKSQREAYWERTAPDDAARLEP